MAMDKTFNAAEAENRLYQAWEQSGCFTAGKHVNNAESGTFCVMIPPPNVTGSLHMGHAFNNTLQDILVRWHRMRGFDTLWQPGQDHAGIATQMVVERQLAANQEPSRSEMGRERFLERVWQWKGESGGTIINQLKRLGASCDWSRNAFTMSGAPGAPKGEDGNFHDAVIRVFVDMYHKGYIYRGKRLVNWDPHFETAISDLEVEQVEVDGHMWRLRYKLADGLTYEHPTEFDEEGNPTAFETRDYLTVATTRPETMLGDTGVAVHPDDTRYQHLIGREAILPLVGRRLKIVADTYADPEKGTGAVKMTPAHDFNDWDVGQRTGLPAINVMTTRAGMYLKDNAEFAEGCDAEGVARVIEALDGADRYEARDWILQVAEAEDWFDGKDADRHMVPHGDRSKVAIEPYLTDQWFVDTSKIVGPALEAVKNGDVRIMPESGERTYYHWLENIEPWCISRQLWWGHQVPVWYGPKLSEDGKSIEFPIGDPEDRGRVSEWDRFCAASEGEAISAARSYYRSADWDGEIVIVDGPKEAEAIYSGNFAASAPPLPLYRDPDVLDTWFSSGLWPIGTLGWPEDTDELKRYFPTSVLVTGQDILFFWVARMMMMQLAVVDEIPFKDVYLHGLVRDAKGKKMSKSLGNVIDPLELIDEYGADALRFASAAMAALGGTLKLDMQRIAGYRNFGTKLWNAARFAEMNEATHGGEMPAPSATVNKWIIGEVGKVREEIDAAMTAYKFNDAALALYAFTWGKVCDWYVEFAKPLLNSDDDAVVTETRATMGWVIDQCLILLHPIMPFITEELWGGLAERANMLMVQEWPMYGAELVDADADREMNWVTSLIEGIRSARAQLRVPAGLKIPMICQELDATGKAALERNKTLIFRLARIDSLSFAADLPKGCVSVPVEGGSFALPLADVIDIDEEKARLQKSMDKLAKEIGGLRGRLNNPKFVASAPEDVVEEARTNLAAHEEEEAHLKAAIERLDDLG